MQRFYSSERMMAERAFGQLSLADGVLREGAPGNATLERVGGLVDWQPVVQLAPLRQGRMGAPAYRSVVLFKALLLQQWYALPARIRPPILKTYGARACFACSRGRSKAMRWILTEHCGALGAQISA
jgi:hypothetical protein